MPESGSLYGTGRRRANGPDEGWLTCRPGVRGRRLPSRNLHGGHQAPDGTPRARSPNDAGQVPGALADGGRFTASGLLAAGVSGLPAGPDDSTAGRPDVALGMIHGDVLASPAGSPPLPQRECIPAPLVPVTTLQPQPMPGNARNY